MQNNENRFQCSYPSCIKTYSTENNLQRHVKEFHLQVRPFNCPICEKAFFAKASLRDHEYIHAGFKPFECRHCTKHFRQSSQLMMHERRYPNASCAVRAGMWDIQLTTLIANEEERLKKTAVEGKALNFEAIQHQPVVLPPIKSEAPSSDSKERQLPSYFGTVWEKVEETNQF